MRDAPVELLGEPERIEADPAGQALISALLREVDGFTLVEASGRRRLELAVPGGVIEVPLRRSIGVGRVAAGRARLRYVNGVRPLAAPELLANLLLAPGVARALGLAGEGSGERIERFVARVRASADNLAATLAAREDDIERLLTGPLGFLAAEQGLLLGHSVHPAPRVREGLSAADAAFVPELQGRAQLCVWAVRRERLWLGGGPAARDHLDALLAGEPEWAEQAAALGPEFALLPLHPLQDRQLREHSEVARWLRRDELRPLGPLGRAWSATSSLRTLFADGARWMLKLSLPVRLTNSLRTLSLAELERGLLLGRVLDGAPEFARRYPQFDILREPAYFGLRADDGGPGPSVSFVALRENPFAADQPAEVLATLLQDHPRTGASRLALRLARAAEETGTRPLVLAERWFAEFLRAVLEPIVAAQAEHGLLLSAHQQNLVIGFDDELAPARAWFRDAQGTAYTELARRRHGERVPGLERAVFRSPMAERVWSYSVVVNGVFNVIASLAQLPGVGQEPLLERLRAHLLAMHARGPADPRALEYLLASPTLWTKANARCFAGGVDEVALADPLDIYTPMANPLRVEDGATTPIAGGRAENFAAAATIELDEHAGRVIVAGEARRFSLALAGAGATIRWPDGARPSDIALVTDHLFARRQTLRHVVHDGGEPIVRTAFYQRPDLWHHRGDAPPVTTERVRTGSTLHPRRPRDTATLLYRRHCPAIDRTFTLRRFDRSRDMDPFCAWMNDPVVAEFWEQAWPRERLSNYIEEKLADPHVVPAIGCFDERPFAYYEIYWAKEDRLGPYYAADDFDRGFHMAVGDPEVRHRGWGRQWFLSMAHFLFLDDPRTQRLVGEPRIDQSRVRAWSASTPWEEWGEVKFPHKRAVLMVLSRERFFAGFEG